MSTLVSLGSSKHTVTTVGSYGSDQFSGEAHMENQDDVVQRLELQLQQVRRSARQTLATTRAEVERLQRENAELSERVWSLEDKLKDKTRESPVEKNPSSTSGTGGGRVMRRSSSCTGAMTWNPDSLETKESFSSAKESFSLTKDSKDGSGKKTKESKKEGKEKSKSFKKDKKGKSGEKSRRFLPWTSTGSVKLDQSQWENRLSALERQKDAEMDELRMKIKCREDAIKNLEQSAKMQGETVESMRAQLDNMKKMEKQKEENEESDGTKQLLEGRDKVIEQLNKRLRDNSVTISNMIRTVKSQSDTMSSLRGEVSKLKDQLKKSEDETRRRSGADGIPSGRGMASGMVSY